MAQSIDAGILQGAKILRRADITEAQREARSLLSHAIGRDNSYIITHGDDLLSQEQTGLFQTFIERRVAREPLQYITGHQEFFKLDFEVSPAVLIPRPETELIVETALELLKDVPAPFIADIGTGSGCIVISLQHEMAEARAIATDISPAALRIAQSNAQRHGVADRLTLVESDCFSGIDVTERFSLVVSNPPYVADHELETLQPEVRDYEPHTALVCGSDGLGMIRRLLREAPPFVRSEGHLIFEIGVGQSDSIERLIDQDFWLQLRILTDLQGIPRTVVLRRK